MLEENKSSTAFRVLRTGPCPTLRGTNIKLGGEREIMHGVNSDGSFAVYVPANANQSSLLRESVQGIKMSIIDLKAKPDQPFSTYLAIENADSRLQGTFEHFVDDVIETLTKDASDPVKAAVLCLERWRQLLAPVKREFLTIEAQVGLLHELLVLSQLIDRSSSDALRFWTGPQGARHDFNLDACAIEVKATLSHDSFRVRISSIEQMVPAQDAALYLVAARFEAVASGGLSLPSVVDSILQKAVDSQELLTKLAAVGYHEEHRDNYKEFKFNLLTTMTFAVENDFPRVTPESLSAPQGGDRISRLQYDINLSGAEILACYVPNGLDEVVEGAPSA